MSLVTACMLPLLEGLAIRPAEVEDRSGGGRTILQHLVRYLIDRRGHEPALAFHIVLPTSFLCISSHWKGCLGSGADRIHCDCDCVKVCCCGEYTLLKKECASSAEQAGCVSLESSSPSSRLIENFQKFSMHCLLMVLAFFHS